MRELIFTPDDILFLKDGRPMEASRSGSGDHFPNPHILHSALLAACHRAFGKEQGDSEDGVARYGSMQTAGPFPIKGAGADAEWLLPRPADVLGNSLQPDLLPSKGAAGTRSSLRNRHDLLPVLSIRPPSKEKPAEWISAAAYEAYLCGGSVPGNGLVDSREIFSSDHTIGIALAADSGTVEEGRFYSASRLRLREGTRMGAVAECVEEGGNARVDRVADLFPERGRIRVGGESRVCQVETLQPAKLSLPTGPKLVGTRVKWVLLTPAIFPNSGPRESRNGHAHPGGWLPGWVDPETMAVQLRGGDRSRRPGESRTDWRRRIGSLPHIPARLVAAVLDRPIPITGWRIPSNDPCKQGARSTLLAVPAGAVYYFEAESPEAAQALADQLNWHGSGDGSRIVNRRSTSFGEKGFGLGVCGPWDYHLKF
jgi:CRISPR-associated protein Cmr3